MTTREDIFAAVSKEYGITVDGILSSSRLRHVAEARQMVMYLMFKRLNCTIAGIAEAVSRNRVTVLYGIERIGELIDVDKAVRARFNSIIKTL